MMKRPTWQLVRSAVALIAICAVAFAAWRLSQPQQYRGVLQYPVIGIGFETTGVSLVTANGTYELAMPRGTRWRDELYALDGQRVVVTGRLTTRKGKWRPKRRIIRVEDMQPEPLSDE